jgi:hypothetical protein
VRRLAVVLGDAGLRWCDVIIGANRQYARSDVIIGANRQAGEPREVLALYNPSATFKVYRCRAVQCHDTHRRYFQWSRLI